MDNKGQVKKVATLSIHSAIKKSKAHDSYISTYCKADIDRGLTFNLDPNPR